MKLHLNIRKSLVRSPAQDLARGLADPARQMSKALKLPLGLDRQDTLRPCALDALVVA
jgi:hypothetical protein